MEDSLNYLKVQLEYSERRVAEQQGHVRALHDAFSAYIQSASAGSADRPTTESASAGRASQTVMPQFGEGFIDQIVRMATATQDIKYRQTASREIADAVTYQLLPAQSESTYYNQLVGEFKGFRSAAPANRTASEQSYHAAYASALEDLRRSVGQTDEIYRLLSQNLNPGNLVYNLTGPVEYRVERPVSGLKLVLYSVLLLLLAIPVVLAACLFHNRIREEERLDLRLHEPVRETAAEASSR